MKVRKHVGRLIAVLTVLLTASAFALAKDVSSVQMEYPASIQGHELAAGQYQVSWVTHSPEATVTFKQGKNVVASVAGKLEDRGKKYESNAVLYSNNPDGSRTILEIRFAGKSQVLTFGESSPAL